MFGCHGDYTTLFFVYLFMCQLRSFVVMSAASRFVESKIRQRRVMMFTKRRDPACLLAVRILEPYWMTSDVYEVCEIDRRHDCALIENHFLIICLASQRCVSVLNYHALLAYRNH